MKQRLTMILMMISLSIVFVLIGTQNISAQDTDGDGVPDSRDNCPVTPNPEKIAFSSFRDGNHEIYVMNANGSNQMRLTNNLANDLEPSFSPNGSKIAFTSDRDGNHEIYVMNANGSNQMRLTNNPAIDYQPSFSPDGSKIAFTSLRDGNYEIYVMNADGSNQMRLTNITTYDFEPTFSPDGSKIAFHAERDNPLNPDIYVMNPDGTNQTRLTNHPASDIEPSFSPDGSKIAFASVRDGNPEIYVMNANGSNQTRLTISAAENRRPSFSPDGSKIAFSSNRDGNQEIYVMNSDGTNPMNLSNNPAMDQSPSWSAQADFDADGIGDACESSANRNSFLNFSNLLRKSNNFIEVDAGSNVPVTFSLNGFKGFDIYDTPPASQQISCVDKSPLGPLQPIQTFPGDPTYNSTFDLYATTWRTQSAWAGTCRRLVLTFNNGTTKTMDYRFR